MYRNVIRKIKLIFFNVWFAWFLKALFSKLCLNPVVTPLGESLEQLEDTLSLQARYYWDYLDQASEIPVSWWRQPGKQLASGKWATQFITLD